MGCLVDLMRPRTDKIYEFMTYLLKKKTCRYNRITGIRQMLTFKSCVHRGTRSLHRDATRTIIAIIRSQEEPARRTHNDTKSATRTRPHDDKTSRQPDNDPLSLRGRLYIVVRRGRAAPSRARRAAPRRARRADSVGGIRGNAGRLRQPK